MQARASSLAMVALYAEGVTMHRASVVLSMHKAVAMVWKERHNGTPTKHYRVQGSVCDIG